MNPTVTLSPKILFPDTQKVTIEIFWGWKTPRSLSLPTQFGVLTPEAKTPRPQTQEGKGLASI